MKFELELPDALIELVAARAAELVLAQMGTRHDRGPYMTAGEAAGYMRTTKQRLYDLGSAGRIPRHHDGARLLFKREDLDSYLEGS